MQACQNEYECLTKFKEAKEEMKAVAKSKKPTYESKVDTNQGR